MEEEKFKNDKYNSVKKGKSYLPYIITFPISFYLGYIGIAIWVLWFSFTGLRLFGREEMYGEVRNYTNPGLYKDNANKYSVNRKANDKRWFEIGAIIYFDELPDYIKNEKLKQACFDVELAKKRFEIELLSKVYYIDRFGEIKTRGWSISDMKYDKPYSSTNLNYKDREENEKELSEESKFIYNRFLDKIGVKDEYKRFYNYDMSLEKYHLQHEKFVRRRNEYGREIIECSLNDDALEKIEYTKIPKHIGSGTFEVNGEKIFFKRHFPKLKYKIDYYDDDFHIKYHVVKDNDVIVDSKFENELNELRKGDE